MAGAPEGTPETVHGTAISVNGRAAIIQGPSGSGKSDLALRCLTVGKSALLADPVHLVADDRVLLSRDGNRLMASPPQQIAGLLEVRGTGVYRLPHQSSANVTLIVHLVAPDAIVRLPIQTETVDLIGVSIPVFALDPFEESAPAKLLFRLLHAEKRI